MISSRYPITDVAVALRNVLAFDDWDKHSLKVIHSTLRRHGISLVQAGLALEAAAPLGWATQLPGWASEAVALRWAARGVAEVVHGVVSVAQDVPFARPVQYVEQKLIFKSISSTNI